MKKTLLILAALLSCFLTSEAGAQTLVPEYVSASSTLEGGNYQPWNAQDYNLQTAWVEGVPGTGIGEELYYGFSEGTVITGGVIFPGYQKSEDLFFKNAAPAAVRIQSGDTGETFYFSETAGRFDGADGSVYTFSFGTPLVCSGPVTIMILDVRTGWKYEDTCISELRFSSFSQ